VLLFSALYACKYTSHKLVEVWICVSCIVTKLYGDYYDDINEVDEMHESSLWYVGQALSIEKYAYLEMFKIIKEKLSKGE